MNDNTIYQMEINTFDAEAQKRQAIEEMAEAIIEVERIKKLKLQRLFDRIYDKCL